jgi:starvation-inducible outer membrane lipoprotein
LTPSWYKLFGATKIKIQNENHDYPRICLDYIHMNPVKAGIVMDPKSWRWSSYHQIFLNDGRDEIVNLEKLKNVVPL